MKRRAFWAALPHTLPICASFLVLGASYGVYMASLGFSFLYPMAMSALIFAGSMEFVTVGLLLSSFNPLSAFLLTLMVNARHLFYGVSMLDPYRSAGRKRWYLIFGMCDESFAVHTAVRPPESVDRGWFLFFITLLNQCWWVAGATIGGLLGSLLPARPKGIEFVMTALYVVIFLEQWRQRRGRIPAVIGLTISSARLALLGASRFMLPAMLLLVAALLLPRKRLEEAAAQ